MGELIRAFDWSETAIGAPGAWSPALRTMVRILLANRFPLLLWWGPDYISIYNDAYRPILGRKHPWGLGRPVRECWSEIWPVLAPLIDTPFNGGPATWSEDLELEIHRAGFTEETHFTVAYSPVPDETAPYGIGGVLATVHEITEKVIGQRRVMALRDLGTRATEAKTAEEACVVAAAALAPHNKDIPFALLYITDSDGESARLAACCGIEKNGALSPAVIDLNGGARTFSHWPLALARRDSQMQFVEKLSSKFGAASTGPWPDAPDSAVVIPIRSNIQGQYSGFLVAGLSSRLKFDEGYRSFLELATSQIATAISNGRAYEEERKRAEALAEIDRAKTAFFSNVSHEFRTPLTLMLGPLEAVLADSSALADGDRKLLATAHRNSLRLLKLVNSLLDFSRIEAGRMKASYQPADLSALTADISSQFRSAMDSAGLEFIVQCETLPEPVFVDREMWEKIVLNLVSNAFKFTFEGSVTVKLEAREGNAVLAVADTGVGIPQAELPHIFERFHRVEGARGRTYEGTGIGLALVQELVKLHGGTIEVDSTLNKGSVFTVALPFGSAHLLQDRIGGNANLISTAPRAEAFTAEALTWVAGKQSAAPSKEAWAASQRPRILIADDNADMRDHLSRLLGTAYEVIAVGDGTAALREARERPPDLVLSDVMMPSLDGFGLLRELRAEPGLRGIPVILLSARSGEEARAYGIEAGADDYLTKPFSARELLARVHTTLDRERMRRDLRRANQDLEQFAYSASHDLQEPLRNVAVYSQLFKKRYAGKLDAQAERFLHYMTEGAQRMAYLVSDLLAYTQAAQVKQEPQNAVDVEPVLAIVLKNLNQAIDESGASVTYDPMPAVMLSEAHLQQLFQNLIANGIKYRKESELPCIHVSAVAEDGYWRFSVSDNGIGIEPEFHAYVFGLFKRLHAKDSKYEGTGLGLAICQKIVERSGGKIWLESEPAKGTVFYFTIPRKGK